VSYRFPIYRSRYISRPVPIDAGPNFDTTYQPSLQQYQLPGDLGYSLEFAISWKAYLRRERPTYIDEQGRQLIIPNEWRIGPPVNYRILYTNIVGYIIYTAKEGGQFVIDPLRLQLLRSHSRSYLDVCIATKSWNSDFFVYIEFFEQYIPGVVIEILILYFPSWYQWYPETTSDSKFPASLLSGSLLHWFYRSQNIAISIEYPDPGNWKIPDFYKELLDIYQTGLKALQKPQEQANFSNKRRRTEN